MIEEGQHFYRKDYKCLSYLVNASGESKDGQWMNENVLFGILEISECFGMKFTLMPRMQ